MINNPHASIEKHSATKEQKHWWQKIKAILFGQWLLARENENHHSRENLKLLDFDNEHTSSLKEWMQSIDVLQSLVQTLRKSDELRQNDEFDLDILAVNTYLFHVDRLLIKIREYLHQFRYRQEQHAQSTLYSYKTDLNQVSSVAQQCYHTIMQLTALLQGLSIKKLYSEALITQIHALELDTTALGSAVRNLNQSAYKNESMMQLAELEQNLLQSLTQAKPVSTPGFSINNMQVGISQSQGEYLRSKAHAIKDVDFGKIVFGLIEMHEMLKKCYVVSRKIFIKDALEAMGDHIEELIMVLEKEELEKNELFFQLNQIFHCVETIRFNTNRESRCSRNLFDKSKCATAQLRKLCQKHPLGLEYLREYSVKRVTLAKPK